MQANFHPQKGIEDHNRGNRNFQSLTVIIYRTEVVLIEELLIATDSVGSKSHLERKENSDNKKSIWEE